MIRTSFDVVVSSAVGAAVGFVTRPCCAGPALLSVLGVSSVGLADVFSTYRGLWMGVAGALLATTLWINMRREGGWFNRSVAISAAVLGFGWSMHVLGVW